jgi:uncharacterized protein (TIGR01777 family)
MAKEEKMNILVTGATGFIGRPLTTRLVAEGHHVIAWVRNLSNARATLHEKIECVSQLDQLATRQIDAVINLAGEPIADKRWTSSRKSALRTSRIDLTEQLVAMLKTLPQAPKVMISGSAIGYYGSHTDDKPLDEQGNIESGFTHRLCADWEAAAMAMQSDATRVCLLRTGIVLGQGGGAMSKMLTPFKLGLGGPIGDGHQIMSWIHLQDWIDAAIFLLNNEDCSGPYNFVSPEPVSNKIFTRALARAVRRPAFFKVPCLVLELAMGEASELLCSGQKVIPKKLVDQGFTFKYTNIDDAFNEIVNSKVH